MTITIAIAADFRRTSKPLGLLWKCNRRKMESVETKMDNSTPGFQCLLNSRLNLLESCADDPESAGVFKLLGDSSDLLEVGQADGSLVATNSTTKYRFTSGNFDV